MSISGFGGAVLCTHTLPENPKSLETSFLPQPPIHPTKWDNLARQGIEMVQEHAPDVVLLDIQLPDMSGLDAFAEIHHIDPRLPVVIITAHGTTETAIEAMKRGAFEYLLKPLDLPVLRDVVSKAIELSRLSRVPAVFEQAAPEDLTVDRIVGLSPPMQEVYKSIGRVAPQDVNVLILGESGTGKELVARAIYSHSRRHQKPFLAINCAAIPEALLESELFGHERGSFTGAERRRIGKFEQAHQGTIFLDEIGDMALATQAKVLRLLQDGRFERVGGNETIQTDVRIIAATNQHLEAMVAQGRFREDLLYRLKVFAIRLPPLRERLEDLPLLVEHFRQRFGGELQKPIRWVPAETLQTLEAYAWPGNIRELQSAIKYALVQASGDVLAAHWLPENVQHPAAYPPPALPLDSRSDVLDIARLIRELIQSQTPDIYRRVHGAVDQILLAEILRHVQGNQVLASQWLGISRTTLRAKLGTLSRDDLGDMQVE
ncbi:MAG: sigma-54 dependent transcriptional regulator [Planctomycetota bacterium]|nr:sigma-54 dependent transcriptional regulator [Planctomycetota bacterium]